MKFTTLLATTALVTGAIMVPATPTQADEPGSVSSRVEFRLTGFDPQVAADHGWEVRIDDEGWQCSVPRGTPVDSCPEDFRLKVDGFASTNTLYNDCGYSWLYWESSRTRYETGYFIYAPKGAPLTHAWQVFFDTNRGPVVQVLNGLGPIGPRWVHQGSLNGATGSYGKATGSVLLSSGATCSSSGPVAS
jgi:hypothetical protein